MTCKTCRFWGRYGGSPWCGNPKIHEVLDGSSGLSPGPDFGCNQYEKRELSDAEKIRAIDIALNGYISSGLDIYTRIRAILSGESGYFDEVKNDM